MRIQFDGVDDLEAALRQAGPTAARLLRVALRREAEELMTRSKDRTPVDTGALRASGHVQDKTSNQAVKMQLGFGGAAAPYAIYVHEMTGNRHPVGQAKFLESTVLEAAPNLGGRLAEHVRRYAGDFKP